MIALACDHTGIELKQEIKKLLDEMGLTYKDFGTNEPVSCDYPIYGYRAAKAVAQGECDRGILICGTGIGIGIAAQQGEGHPRVHLLGRILGGAEQASQQQQYPDHGRPGGGRGSGQDDRHPLAYRRV